MNSIRISNLATTAALLFCIAQSCAGQSTFSLNPSADAFVTTGPTGNLSANNYGGAGALGIAAPGSAKGEFQSVLQFGLASAASSFNSQFGVGQWSVQSVTLQLTATAPNNSIFNATAAGQFAISLMQNNGWSEGTGTPMAPTNNGISFSTLSNYVDAADSSLGTFSFNGATNGNVIYTLNLTPDLSADILSGGTASLRMFAADSVVSALYDSRNFTIAADRPLLTITAVPEPSALALGVLGAFVFVRRQRPERRNEF